VVGRFHGASNATLLVALQEQDGGWPELDGDRLDLSDLDPAAFAVYKPQVGETPLWDFPDGTLWRREVAASVLDRALGLDLVPRTLRRDDLEHGVGSLQRLVPHDPEEHYFHLIEEADAVVVRQLRRMVVFDLLIDNADRKGGHVLLEHTDEGPRVRLVDHGVCFHPQPHLRTVGWHFAGEQVPEQDAALGTRLVTMLDDGDEAVAELVDLLSEREVERLRERAERVGRMARYPDPVGDRPVPWPML
jgi:uncharacterized repeat protein (TIGR03843 family)